jgi:hypothetical protein
MVVFELPELTAFALDRCRSPQDGLAILFCKGGLWAIGEAPDGGLQGAHRLMEALKGSLDIGRALLRARVCPPPVVTADLLRECDRSVGRFKRFSWQFSRHAGIVPHLARGCYPKSAPEVVRKP